MIFLNKTYFNKFLTKKFKNNFWILTHIFTILFFSLLFYSMFVSFNKRQIIFNGSYLPIYISKSGRDMGCLSMNKTVNHISNRIYNIF